MALSNREKDNVVNALISAHDGAPAEVPFSLLQEWSDDFRNKIGSGSFGNVFQGVYSDSTSTKVGFLAIKKASPGALVTPDVTIDEVNRDLLNSVRREIRVLSSIRHPNVIKLLGYSIKTDMGGRVDDHNLCLVYELADEGGLDSHLTDETKARTLNWRRRISVAVGAAAALSYFHNNPAGKTYHRDVKSANFVLFGDFTVKLIDCGLSKYIPSAAGGSAGGSIFTRTGQMYGTPGYMCLQYLNTGDYDAKSEVYSFGVVLAELLSGIRSGTEINGEKFFYNDEPEIHKNISPDLRAGDWPQEVVDVWRGLLAICLCNRKQRVSGINTLLRQLKELENKFCPSAMRNDERIASLRAEVDKVRLKETVDERNRRQAMRRCVQCSDELEGTKGIACEEGHFTCDECFPSPVLHQVSFEQMETFKRLERCICCPYCLDPRILDPHSRKESQKCFFSDRDIAMHAGEDAAAAYFKAKDDVLVGRVTMEVEKKVEQKVRAEIALEAEAERGRDTRLTRHRLACEELLNLKCPYGCNAKIDMGFDACLAVTCTTCNREFCAWCFQQYFQNHQDCANHVRTCRLNPYQGDISRGGGREIIDHTNRRVAHTRQQQLIDYIRNNVDQSDRTDLLRKLKDTLEGFYISIETLAASVGGGGRLPGGREGKVIYYDIIILIISLLFTIILIITIVIIGPPGRGNKQYIYSEFTINLLYYDYYYVFIRWRTWR